MGFKSVFWMFVVCSGTATTTGQAGVVGPTKPIVAIAGDDVVLPCQLEPSASASNTLVEWTRPDLRPTYVHVLQDGRPQTDLQNPSFTERTALFTEELKKGNVSLKLSRVKLADEGRYRCFLPSLVIPVKEALVQLIVGVVVQPVVSIMGIQDKGVVLQCESGGWHPEPEVEWLDSEGLVLSAGSTETLKDPDGTYTVRRNVTVYQTATNRFTCRVQQQLINQTREVEILVSGGVFVNHSNPYVGGVIGFIVGAAVSIATVVAAILLYKRKVIKEKQPTAPGNGQEQTERNTELDRPLLDQSPKADTTVDLESVTSGFQSLNPREEGDLKKQLQNLRSQLMDKDKTIKTLEEDKVKLQSSLDNRDQHAKTLEEDMVKLQSSFYGLEGKFLLVRTLEELKSRKINLKTFHNHLCQTWVGDLPTITEDKIKNAAMVTTVDVMVEHYNLDGALSVTKEILRKRNETDLIEKLEEKLPMSQRTELRQRRLLLDTLEKLKDKEQKIFKERLQKVVMKDFGAIPEKQLLNANLIDTVDKMVQARKPEDALMITKEILKEMKLDKFVKFLEEKEEDIRTGMNIYQPESQSKLSTRQPSSSSPSSTSASTSHPSLFPPSPDTLTNPQSTSPESHCSPTPTGDGAEPVHGSGTPNPLPSAGPNEEPITNTGSGSDSHSVPEVKGQRSPSDHGDTSLKSHFIDRHREELINGVCSVISVLRDLRKKQVISKEVYDMILAEKTNQDKMKVLYEDVQGADTTQKNVFHQVLREREPSLISKLERKDHFSSTPQWQNRM